MADYTLNPIVKYVCSDLLEPNHNRIEPNQTQLERSLMRMVRVDAQYQALVAETSGRECSLETALGQALLLLRQATGKVESSRSMHALDDFSNAIKVGGRRARGGYQVL